MTSHDPSHHTYIHIYSNQGLHYGVSTYVAPFPQIHMARISDESRPVKPRDTRLDRGSRDRGPARDADINIPFIPFQPTSLRHSHHSSDIRSRARSHLDRIRIDRASHDAATASTRDVCLRTRLHPRGDAHRDRAPRREREDERERAPQLVPGLGRARLLGWIHAVVSSCFFSCFVWANSVILIREWRFASPRVPRSSA